MAHKRPVMNRFCFTLGFALNSTTSPTPAPLASPATAALKVIEPERYS